MAKAGTGGNLVQCPSCAQIFDGGRFQAGGAGAIDAQVQIVTYQSKMFTIRVVASYGVSALFAMIGSALIIFAPPSREVAANVTSSALLVLAMGMAGFTRFKAKAPGLAIEGGKSR